MDGLTPGRVVHFVADKQWKADDPHLTLVTNKYDHVAAMITGVQDAEAGMVHLAVFYKGVNSAISRTHCGYDATGTLPSSWHWPERA